MDILFLFLLFIFLIELFNLFDSHKKRMDIIIFMYISQLNSHTIYVLSWHDTPFDNLRF